jgi:hypothetical protein
VPVIEASADVVDAADGVWVAQAAEEVSAARVDRRAAVAARAAAAGVGEAWADFSGNWDGWGTAGRTM